MKVRLTKVKKPAQLLKSKMKKVPEVKKSNKMQSMSVDAFMNEFANNEANECHIAEDKKIQTKNLKTSKKKSEAVKMVSKKGPKKKVKNLNEIDYTESDHDNSDKESLNTSEDDRGMESDFEPESENEYESHKKHLNNLKQSDPEFYKYLEENDEDLLNFYDSDAENNAGDEESDSKEELIHKPPDELEVASDDSDYELEEKIKQNKEKSNKITKEMISKWQNKLQTRCKIQDLRDVTEAFHSALISLSPNDHISAVYKVEGSVVFNSIIRMCITDFLPALQKILKCEGSKINPAHCKNWNRVQPLLKNYLIDLAELSSVTSPNMLRVLLKHIHQLCPFIVCFSAISPKYLKRLIELWATDEDVIRILAFLCVLRLSNLIPSLLKQALKVMHLTYVRNTKFVSPNVLPGINFMRQSLCEMFALDNTVSYEMVFLFIRQMAIHLRSAIIQKKKEAYKVIYNWAYVLSLHLWAELFGIVPQNSALKSLIYPLVQIIIGTIKLIPSSTFYPLRFYCCKILILIRDKCDVFIPILPFLLEVLRDFNFNRQHKKLTVKPLDFTCLLRCSKSQMKENGFKDALIENVYSLLMEYLAVECHRLSFPDVTLPCTLEIKRFMKSCKFANYVKKMKSIVDKISENSKFIEQERKKLALKIHDLKAVETAEAAIRAKEPPFLKYYTSWKKIHIQQQAKKFTNNQKLGDFKLPEIIKPENKRKKTKESEGPAVLFPSDDEESEGGSFFDDDNIADEEPPSKRKKMGSSLKKPKKEATTLEKANEVHDSENDDLDHFGSEDEEDIVEDLNYSDFKK